MTRTHPNPHSVPARMVLITACLLALIALASTGTSGASHEGDGTEHPVERSFSWGYPPNALQPMP